MQISRYSLATTKIQNFYRAYFRQRQFMAVCSSAKTIQATWRHHRINTCRKFALKLQAFARQCSCRKQVRSRRDAVTVLQNAARCYHAKHSFALLRIERSILIATVVFCQVRLFGQIEEYVSPLLPFHALTSYFLSKPRHTSDDILP